MSKPSISLACKIWRVADLKDPNDPLSKVFGFFMIILIFTNVAAVVAGTVKSVEAVYGPYLDAFEAFSVFAFTLEYLARLIFCVEEPCFSSPVKGRLRFMIRPLSIVDLLSVLPFYLPVVGVDLRALRVLRLLRLFSVLKVARYYSALSLIVSVLKNKLRELVLVSMLMAMAMLCSATTIYYCENEAQPQVFANIPVCMEWAIATLTTVGSDMKPVTGAGRLCASLSAILGIGMFALPTSILGAGFMDELRKRREPALKTKRSRVFHRGK